MDLRIQLDSIQKFYQEADLVEEQDKDEWNSIEREDNPRFRGLSKDEILKSKWNYTKGLDKLKTIETDLNLGGTKRKYKYAEDDGDDMSYDRYIEGMPCMRKRIRNHGNGNGKFITLYVSICENCWCSAESLMQRAYTAMRIVDYLESNGYRTQIVAYADNRNPGKLYKGGEYHKIDTLSVEVTIKKFDEPLIKGQILTAISPWFFRYWMFKFWTAKFKMNWGYGQSYRRDVKEDKANVYIQTGEALTPNDSEKTIERIKRIFEKDEQ